MSIKIKKTLFLKKPLIAVSFIIIFIACSVLFPSCIRVQQKPEFKTGEETVQKDERKINQAEKATGNEQDNDISTGEDATGKTETKASAETVDGKEQAEDSISIDMCLLGQLEERFMLKNAFSGILFDRPVDIQNANDGSGRLFIVEQQGKIYTLSGNDPANKELFLDISDRVISGGEKGLLGLAFDPEFKDNGLFYVNYTNRDSTVISSFKTSALSGIADAESEDIILSILQPFSNHNGGQIASGPDDSYL